MSDTPRIEPPEVIQAVETYVEGELRDAARYSNRTPLDESGVFSLHLLAASIYADGYDAGERAAGEKARHAARRRTDLATPDLDAIRAQARQDAITETAAFIRSLRDNGTDAPIAAAYGRLAERLDPTPIGLAQ